MTLATPNGQIARIQALTEEIRASSERAGFSFDARIAGHRLRFRCADEELHRYARSIFLDVAERPFASVEAVFYMDTGLLDGYELSDAGMPISVSLSGDGLRGVYSPPNSRFWLYDRRANTGYERFLPEIREHPVRTGHSFFKTLRVWAETADLCLLHGAAVGAGGKGALIAGMGGRGKTSLALACLFEGMDYVSDDYFLLEGTSPKRAMPIYSIIALNPDMEPRFPEISGTLLQRNPRRGDRGTFRLDGYRDRFRSSMPVDVLVYLHFSDRGEPRILPMDAGRAAIQIALSTAKQAGEGRNPAYIKHLLGLLSDMPAYCIELCDRPRQNARALKEFLEGL